MSSASGLIETDFSPELIKTMGEVFDTVWADAGQKFTGHKADEIQSARAALARRIVWLAQRGHRDPDILRAMAQVTLRPLKQRPNPPVSVRTAV
ncbi:MAG: hypothetical protein ACKVP3_06365 [Hyphomicrobiaceae bacterium]